MLNYNAYEDWQSNLYDEAGEHRLCKGCTSCFVDSPEDAPCKFHRLPILKVLEMASEDYTELQQFYKEPVTQKNARRYLCILLQHTIEDALNKDDLDNDTRLFANCIQDLLADALKKNLQEHIG